MPKYLNSGAEVVTVGSFRIEPNETKESRIWLTTPLPTNISLVTSAPIFDVVVLSQKITSGVTVAVPASLETNYRISVFCTAGDVTIQTDTTDSVARILGAGMDWNAICLQRTIKSNRQRNRNQTLRA